MRLTVGPLPAGVYWRRRLLVLVGLATVVLVVAYACTGAPTAGSEQPPPASTPASTPSPTTTLLRPTIGTPPPTTPASQPAYTLPVPGATGPCADAELEITASAATAEVTRGQPVDVTIRIKNISARTCVRDVGADVQELRLLDQDRIVWSSDDCNPNTGHDVRSFGPGHQESFTRRWSGTRSRAGDGSVNCSAGPPDNAATYNLVARLDQKLSAPFALRIRM